MTDPRRRAKARVYERVPGTCLPIQQAWIALQAALAPVLSPELLAQVQAVRDMEGDARERLRAGWLVDAEALERVRAEVDSFRPGDTVSGVSASSNGDACE